ncbi:MAG: hypothetical protein Q7R70_04265 [Candidatus Diapherotrites archaeon]|nr:hypothetical protein [Candidatus Diapherotrites archaeon]
MKKPILLIFGILAFAVLLSGCSQDQPKQQSGLESDSTALDSTLNSADQQLNDPGTDLTGIVPVDLPADAGIASTTALEADAASLSADASSLDSLSTELSDFLTLDSVQAINPADLQ